MRTKTCNLTPSETHLGSVCVAIVFGALGGWFGFTVAPKIVHLILDHSNPPLILTAIMCACFGFFCSWFICKFWFNTAHEWYGNWSFAHWVYNIVGVVSALGVFWVLWGLWGLG